MNIDFTKFIALIKKLIFIIFEKYDVSKEFDALGIDIAGILGGNSETEE